MKKIKTKMLQNTKSTDDHSNICCWASPIYSSRRILSLLTISFFFLSVQLFFSIIFSPLFQSIMYIFLLSSWTWSFHLVFDQALGSWFPTGPHLSIFITRESSSLFWMCSNHLILCICLLHPSSSLSRGLWEY